MPALRNPEEIEVSRKARWRIVLRACRNSILLKLAQHEYMDGLMKDIAMLFLMGAEKNNVERLEKWVVWGGKQNGMILCRSQKSINSSVQCDR